MTKIVDWKDTNNFSVVVDGIVHKIINNVEVGKETIDDRWRDFLNG